MVFRQEPTLDDYIQAKVNCFNLSFFKVYVHSSQEWQFPENGHMTKASGIQKVHDVLLHLR